MNCLELLNWKDVYVLSYRKLKIEENEVMKHVQSVVDNLAKIFNEKNIKKDVTIDFNDNIVILPDDRFRIGINFNDEKTNVRFSRLKRNEDGFENGNNIVDILVNGGFYKVYYYGEKKETFNCAYIDDDLIDSIFEYLLT